MFIWVSCGCWVMRDTTVLQETLFFHAIFGEGIGIQYQFPQPMVSTDGDEPAGFHEDD